MPEIDPEYRIGNGFDSHRLVSGRRLVLGGVVIPFEKGLDGHSDADALLHAICDAILGALALGDIGQHFPDTDARWKGCDSAVFVHECLRLAEERGYQVSNMDATIMAQQPKMMPYIDAMRRRIADLLRVLPECVGLKAKTMEHMGFIGRGEGIAVMAVVMLKRQKSAVPNSL